MDSWELVLQAVEEIEINATDLNNNPVNQEAVRCVVADAKRFFAAMSIRLIWLLNHISAVVLGGMHTSRLRGQTHRHRHGHTTPGGKQDPPPLEQVI